MQDDMLRKVRIASPCPVQWTDMSGDDRARFCGQCQKNVYHLSGMTRTEVETLLTENDDVCGAFYRRADGTILTADCPVGRQTVRERSRKALARAVALVIIGCGAITSWVLVSRTAKQDEPRGDIEKAIHAGLKPIKDYFDPPEQEYLILGAICPIEPPTELPAGLIDPGSTEEE